MKYHTLIKVLSVNGEDIRMEYPTQCPVCKKHSEVRLVERCDQSPSPGIGMQAVFQCGFHHCRSYFIGFYGSPGRSVLRSLAPTTIAMH